MDQRDKGREGGGAPGGVPPAGPANTPPFESRSAGTPGGRPPSHREQLGESAKGGPPAGTETEQAFEEVRDQVARQAAPVIAEKMQEAVTESAQQIDVSEQAEHLATAVKHDAKRMASETLGNVTDQVEERANDALHRAADGLESAAHRIDEFGDRYGAASGVRGTAGNMAHQVADTFESTAHYLRENDVRELQQNLERQVRENPLQTLLIGVATGWIIGKILR